MACYLICAGTDAPMPGQSRVKIGFAVNIEARISTLQAGCWETLYLVKSWDNGCKKMEAWLHRHFASESIARDWFAFHPDMLLVEPPQFEDHRSVISEMIDMCGGPYELGRTIGQPATTVGNWGLRNSIPAKYHCAVLMASDGKITAEQIVLAHANKESA